MRAYYFLGRILGPFMILAMYIYSYIFRTPRARIVLENEGGEILLVLSWLSGDKWGFPGGGVGRNEESAEAAVRELKEEVGIVLDVNSIKPFMSFHCRGHEEAAFLGRVQKAGIPKDLPHKFEIKDAGWFSLDELPKLDSPAQRIADEVAKNV